MGRTLDNLHKKNSVIIVIVFLVLVIGVSGFYGYIYSVTSQYKDAIYPGVNIENKDMGGRTKEEVLKFLSESYEKPLESAIINIKVKNKTYNLNFKDINVKYNTREVVEKAFNYGKDLNLFSQYKLIKGNSKVNFILALAFDEQPIKNLIEEIDQSLNKEVKDATIKRAGGKFHIEEEKIKEEIYKDELYSDITSNINNRVLSFTIDVPVILTTPKITAKELKTINSLISSYSTKFIQNERAVNIGIATKASSNRLLMPGDIYSFNELIGGTTKEKGYIEAPVIKKNKLEPGVGGGICQVSSTLHNAVLRAGITPTYRAHHSMPVGYVEKGTDATVFYNVIDYKFQNTLNYPIYVEGYTLNNQVIFNIYSNSNLKAKTYKIISEIYETIPRKIKYIKDNNLKQGEELIENNGSDGIKVKVYRITYENGSEINKKLIYNDFYKPVDKVIKKNY